MDRKLRSSLGHSPEEFLSVAARLSTKVSSLKTLIFNLGASSAFVTSLPAALLVAIRRCLDEFENRHSPESGEHLASEDRRKTLSYTSAKRLRRSLRNAPPEDDRESRSGNPLKILQIYASIVHICVSHPKDIFSPDDLLPCVQAMHDRLVLFESDTALQGIIASLCEEWWKSGFNGKETLISQSLPFLLSRSLCNGKKGNVRRVYLLRDAFNLFDFFDDSIEDLKFLLLRCVVTPIYLKTEEGRKFLSFLFGLNVQLVKEIIGIIHSQIPFGRKSVLQSYARVVFGAWKAVEGPARAEIEDSFLQGLVESAIHASSRALAASVRRVLGGFIGSRMVDGVEQLLFRLSEPILFRSLLVANSNVRQNALILLVELFPLEDPDATKEVKDNLLDKQFFLIEKLLVDDCPDVRVSAVEGSCRVLCLYWEIIPSSTTTKMLLKIFDEMSHDGCSNVRLSVLNGILYLLSNPQCHEVLKALFPKLGHMLQDPVLFVRVAVCDLLLAIRDARALQFLKVVSMDALFHALADDHPFVAQKITRLLIPSYFPSQVPSKQACGHCIDLVKKYPSAGARFCEYAYSEGLCLESVLELLRFSFSSILASADTDSDETEGLIVAVSKICMSLSGDASFKATLNEMLSGGKFKKLLKAATTPRARTSVLHVATTFSPDDISDALKHCLSLVMGAGDVCENSEKQAEVAAAHQLILSCGLFDEMLEDLTDQLLQSIPANLCNTFPRGVKKCQPDTKRKLSTKIPFSWKSVKVKARPKSSQPAKFHAIAAGAAWQIKNLLSSKDTRNALLDSPLLGVAYSALKITSQMTIAKCLHFEPLEISYVEAYMALTLHMALEHIKDIGFDEQHGDHYSDSDSSLPSLAEETRIDLLLSHLLGGFEKFFVHYHGPAYSHSTHSGKKKRKGKQSSKVNRREPLADLSNLAEGTSADTVLSEDESFLNIAKLATTVLKFILDATALNCLSNVQAKSLQFVSAFIHYLTSCLQRHLHPQYLLKNDHWEETFIYIRSFFTYAAKLLNLLLSNSDNLVLPKASSVASALLDLIATTELNLGSSYARQLVSSIKQWLPDVVLALVSEYYELDEAQTVGFLRKRMGDSKDFPVWLEVLAKVELSGLHEMEDEDVLEGVQITDSDSFCAFEKLISLLVVLLTKGDTKILEAFILVTVSALTVVLSRRKDYSLAVGLVGFLCKKLLTCKNVLRERRLILESVKELHQQIEEDLENVSPTQGPDKTLQRANSFLESVLDVS